MDRAKIPPIINCRTICQKDNRQLIWVQAGLNAEKANMHAGIATSMKDYLAWKDRISMIGLVLLEMDDKDLELVQKYKVNLFVTQAVFAKYPREVWVLFYNMPGMARPSMPWPVPPSCSITVISLCPQVQP